MYTNFLVFKLKMCLQKQEILLAKIYDGHKINCPQSWNVLL